MHFVTPLRLPARGQRGVLYRAALILLLVLLGVSAPVRASPAALTLEDLTWTEVEAAVHEGYDRIIIPVGGTEQSGPNIALGKHNRRVARLSERIAQSLGRTLIAPVIAYVPEGRIDPPTGHMRFIGTLSVPTPVFEGVVSGAAQSLIAHGFKTVILIGDHGGYQDSLVRVAAALNRNAARTGARVLAVTEYYRAAADEFPARLRAEGASAHEIGTHAGLADAALTLALAPELVRREGLAHDVPEARTGSYGDPRRATVEAGREGADLIVEHTVQAIRAALASP